MKENEFKKLASNSRDWLIYQLLSEKSKETVVKDLVGEKSETGIKGSRDKSCGSMASFPNSKPAKPKGETSIEEIVTGIVKLVTDKAVLIGVANRVAWFPKSVILNLDKIALKQSEIVELKIVDWFKYKIEWKVSEQ